MKQNTLKLNSENEQNFCQYDACQKERTKNCKTELNSILKHLFKLKCLYMTHGCRL